MDAFDAYHQRQFGFWNWVFSGMALANVVGGFTRMRRAKYEKHLSRLEMRRRNRARSSDSEPPVARLLRFRGIQNRIVAVSERIDPIGFRAGPCDPLQLLGGEFSILAGTILDRCDELAYSDGAVQPADVTEQCT